MAVHSSQQACSSDHVLAVFRSQGEDAPNYRRSSTRASHQGSPRARQGLDHSKHQHFSPWSLREARRHHRSQKAASMAVGRSLGQAATLLLLTAAAWTATAQNAPDNAAINRQFKNESLEVCSWPSAPPFVASAVNDPGHFADVKAWTSQQWQDWISKDLKNKWLPSAVFAGIGILSALIFLVWRLLHMCCACCCSKARPSAHHEQFISSNGAHDPYSNSPGRTGPPRPHGCCGWWMSQNSSRAMAWLKPFVVVLVLCAMALMVYGLVHAHKNLDNEAWDHVDAARNQINAITFQVEYVLNNVSSINNALTNIQNALINQQLPGNSGAVQSTQQAVVSGLNSAKALVTQLTTTYANQARRVRNDVVGKIDEIQSKYSDDSDKLDKAQYGATLALFILGLFILVLVLIAITFNIPGMFTFCLLLVNIMLVLYFLLALFLAIGGAAQRDACPAAEVIVKANIPNPQQYETLANYYFFNVGGNLSQVLKASNIIDLDQVNSLAPQVQEVLTSVADQLPPGSDLQQGTASASTTLTNSLAAKDLLLQLASYDEVNPLYVATKGFACCDIGDIVLSLWKALTGAAWVMLLMSWLANALISQYDKAPGANRGCCGWICLGPFLTPAPRASTSGAGNQAMLYAGPTDTEIGKMYAQTQAGYPQQAYPGNGYGGYQAQTAAPMQHYPARY